MKRKIAEPAIENPKSKIRNRNWFLILIISVVALGVFGTGMSFLEQSAKDEMLARKNQNYQPSLFGRVNPFLPDPTRRRLRSFRKNICTLAKDCWPLKTQTPTSRRRRISPSGALRAASGGC
ncbi:MAG: hypothetical protein IPK58_25315 [Acidobacteria bacterium]|nr:hypothetical protein [Acidobacteriota bacterium]